MDTLDTMITNARILANTNIDWSLTAGPIWLVGMMCAFGIMLLVGTART